MNFTIIFSRSRSPVSLESTGEVLEMLLKHRQCKAYVEASDGSRVSAAAFVSANQALLTSPAALASATRFIAAAKSLSNYAADSDILWSVDAEHDLSWRVVCKLVGDDTLEKLVLVATLNGVELARFKSSEVVSALSRISAVPERAAPKPVATKIITRKTNSTVRRRFFWIFLASWLVPVIAPLIALGIYIAVINLSKSVRRCKCSHCDSEVEYEDTCCGNCLRNFTETQCE